MSATGCRYRWAFGIAAFALSGVSAGGQAPTGTFRLDLEEPQLVLAAGGRMGACDEVTFTRDGTQLLAVGDDKVVHTWDVTPNGLAARPPLRWNVFRERRGSIYALAFSPGERYVAVAGFGRKDADVVVFDRAAAKIVHALTPVEGSPYLTARTVWSLAYDRGGDRIAVGQEDGSVWVWTPATGAVVRIAVPEEADARAQTAAISNRTAKTIWVGFAGESLRFARGDGTVFEAEPGGPGARKLFQFGYPIAGVAAPEDGRWLAARPLKQAPTGNRIERWSATEGKLLDTVEYKDLGKGQDRLFPVAIATDRDGRRLAIGNQRGVVPHFFAPPLGEIAVYDLTADGPVARAIEQFDGADGKPSVAPDAIAFHPTDPRLLAVAGGHDHETGLWEIAGPRLRRATGPTTGVGRGVWQVGTRDDGSVLCFRQNVTADPVSPNNRGRGPWRGFDFDKLAWVAVDQPPAEAAVAEKDGWHVEYGERKPKDGKISQLVWRVVHPDGFDYALPFDLNQEHTPTCYTFLPAGPNGKARIAVGCYWGYSIFEFEKGTAPRRVAKGIGHQGYVTSIAPARGGRMLVTGSNDQTVCVWAVKPWDHIPTLGAAFAWRVNPVDQVNRFEVVDVQEGSPAWEAGLSKGDRILKVGYDLKFVEPESQWLSTIADAEPDRELGFLIDRPIGDRVKRTAAKTKLLTRPQVRFFPSAGYDWVMYRYVDYYFAAGGNGDSYLGWLIGGKTAADTPEFHPADRFRKVFHAPGKVRGSVRDFIREPDRPLTRTYLPPQIEVKSAGADPVTLEIAVEPRADLLGQPIPLEKVELWLDDEVLLQSWPGGAGTFRESAVVRAGHLRPGKNRLNVVAYAKTRAEKTVEIDHKPPVLRPARLRALVVGVNEYPYLSESHQLRACVNDAALIGDAMKSLGRDRAFGEVAVTTLADRSATPKAIFAAVDDLTTGVTPDDWLIVFLAGHGFAEPEAGSAGGDRKFVRGSWFFGAYAAANGLRIEPDQYASRGGSKELIAAVRKTGSVFGGAELLDRLAKVNCRKVVLLDSCHSGAIAQDPGRDLRPDGKGAVVLTASAPDETASEFEPEFEFGGKPVRRPQGYFAFAVYNALTRDRAATDRNKDGLLTLEELHLAAARGVSEARKANGLDGPAGTTRQTVLAYPAALRDVVFATVRRP